MYPFSLKFGPVADMGSCPKFCIEPCCLLLPTKTSTAFAFAFQ
uniref:Uncharacterized protein n=1 Tax=Arundo donax TaxID=35708 RepID=A0A0A9CJ69_ARUDO